MRKTISNTVEVTETKEVIVAKLVQCNRCEKKYETITDDEWSNWDSEMQSFSCGFGYGSKYDSEKWSFDLCEECLVAIFKEFKIVPEGFRCDEYTDLSAERHQKVFENWKQTGEWEEFKYHTYEELLGYEELFKDDYFRYLIERYHPDKI